MEKSDIIQFHQMMVPTLNALQTPGGSANIDELNSNIIDIMRLSEEMRDVLHKEDGTLTEVEYLLAWARTYLKKYGLIDNSSRGIWSFTDTFDGDIGGVSSDEIIRKVRSIPKRVNIQATEDDNWRMMEWNCQKRRWIGVKSLETYCSRCRQVH